MSLEWTLYWWCIAKKKLHLWFVYGKVILTFCKLIHFWVLANKNNNCSAKVPVLINFIYFSFNTTEVCAQNLLWALPSGITPDWPWKLWVMPRIKYWFINLLIILTWSSLLLIHIFNIKHFLYNHVLFREYAWLHTGLNPVSKLRDHTWRH